MKKYLKYKLQITSKTSPIDRARRALSIGATFIMIRSLFLRKTAAFGKTAACVPGKTAAFGNFAERSNGVRRTPFERSDVPFAG